MARFIDRPELVVCDAITGMLMVSPPGSVGRLDGHSHVKVVMRTDAMPDHVAVVAGGGSGHEPSDVGFVGAGMLDAAVLGDVFSSPTSDAVFKAIQAVAGPPGCLLVVKNYTGDRLSFGLAAERAKALGISVEMVLVEDDIALPDDGRRRGVAGAVLLYKLAGEMASRGADLATLCQCVSSFARGLRTIGVSLEAASMLTDSSRHHRHKPEMGCGIHGEPAAAPLTMSSASDVATQVAQTLDGELPSDRAVVLLVNNFGSTTDIEMNVFVRDLLRTPLGARCRLLIGPARLMTSLDAYGLSVSAAPLTDDLSRALRGSTSVRAWPGAFSPHPEECIGGAASQETEPELRVPMARRNAHCLSSVCAQLIASEKHLNALDARVGDGDLGSTMAAGCRAILSAIDAQDGEVPWGQSFLSIADVVSRAMGGSSGVILAMLLTAAGRLAAAGVSPLVALRKSIEEIQGYGIAHIGERTFVDALLPGLDARIDARSWQQAAQEVAEAAQRTARITSTHAGRSAYLSADALNGHLDAGAAAVGLIFSQIAAYFAGPNSSCQ